MMKATFFVLCFVLFAKRKKKQKYKTSTVLSDKS